MTRRGGRLGLDALIVCALVSAAAPVLAQGPKRVLVLHSFGNEFQPYSTVASAFRTELAQQSPDPIEFHDASLEMARWGEGQSDGPLTAYLRSLHAARHVDLVVPVGSPAAEFCLRHCQRALPSVPILLTGVEQRRLAHLAQGRDVPGVLIQLDLPGVIEHALRLLPDTEAVAVVMGDSPLERFWVGELKREWSRFDGRVRFLWFDGLPVAEMLRRLGALPPRTVIVYGQLSMDGAGVPYEQDRGLALLHQADRAPIFGLYDYLLGRGIVGGPLASTHGIGRESARAAVRLLAGTPPRVITTAVVPADPPVYDWRELRRWDIDQARLSADSAVLFKRPTWWEQYRWIVIGVVSLCIVEAFLIAFLVRSGRDLRQTRSRLEQTTHGMRLAAQAGGLTLWTWDVPRDRVWLSDGLGARLGWRSSDAGTLADFLDTVHPDDRARTRRAVARSLEGKGTYEAEYRLLLADGSTRWIAGRGQLERDGAGRPAVLRGVAVDVSARKQAESEVLRQRSELAHLTRVSILGELSGSIAHELNQPLASILSNSQAALRLLSQEPPDLDELREILVDIVQDDQRAGEVIRRLRMLLKKGEVQRQSVRLPEVIDDALDLMRTDLTRHGVVADVVHGPDLPPVEADRVQVQQVLLNLMMNACDAMSGAPSGEGKLTIRSEVLDGEAVSVSVADQGIGIPAAKLEKVFEPFFSTKAHGLGLGLSVCRTIIAAHGGRLWASANPDRGTTFRFTLPVAGVRAGLSETG
jgi:PAS domain S-box-containing protein